MSKFLSTPNRLLAARRQFMITAAGLAGAGILGLHGTAFGADATTNNGVRKRRSAARDGDILNLALNLEYLEAEFYLRAVGDQLGAADIGDNPGAVTGGAAVPFVAGGPVEQYANEIAADELAHVRFLRSALGDAAVDRPQINLDTAFTAAAQAAGLIGAGETFNAFADENSFLLAAFIFEDVGVTAYSGAAPLLLDRDLIGAAAGILAVEAYHAANIRTVLFARELEEAAGKISDARDSLDGPDDLDQGIVDAQGNSNIVPTDANGLAFARTPVQVLNIVYLNPNTTPGGFFPAGLNGRIR